MAEDLFITNVRVNILILTIASIYISIATLRPVVRTHSLTYQLPRTEIGTPTVISDHLNPKK